MGRNPRHADRLEGADEAVSDSVIQFKVVNDGQLVTGVVIFPDGDTFMLATVPLKQIVESKKRGGKVEQKFHELLDAELAGFCEFMREGGYDFTMIRQVTPPLTAGGS